MDNGTVALAFLPTVGGRLISVAAHGRELLWRNPEYLDASLQAVRRRSDWPRHDGTFASWVNIGGSKTWPAPQGWNGEGEWAGPPDPVLDSGAWSIESRESDDGLVVIMTSADDPRTGVRITKEFTVPGSGPEFAQQTTFTNISYQTVTWAVWEVAQIDTEGGGVHAEVEVDVTDTRVVDLGSYHGTFEVEHGEGTVSAGIQDVVVKRGFPSASGRIAYYEDTGVGLELSFSPIVDAIYPDQGSRAELWMQAPIPAPLAELDGLHPDAWLAELEVLSPLTTMRPGESVSFEIGWRALLAD
ncbi:DUF4380 domain-containing protein [Agromyces albus]|uniref:DUF4380 domain-containing protein n=1 Tax=Agromyces albus TaxID=205332 RepID=UPI0013E90F6C|nr:DUF4380 domain-containing protein [Agromyces albus]